MSVSDPQPITVVYVDDDPDIRTVVALATRLDPLISLTLFPTGAAALAYLEGAARPDLILLDVMMPGQTGPDLLNVIRTMPGHADTRIAFMTARARQSDLAAYRRLGAIGIIMKPFDPLTLASELRALVAASSS